MWTVFGNNGFIGRNILAYLSAKSSVVFTPGRDDLWNIKGKNLGNVIYCIGVTSKFRNNNYNTFEAHSSLLQRIVENNYISSITYISTTRIYLNNLCTDEDAPLLVNPGCKDDTYAISKIAGESYLLHCGIEAKIVRLSNVYSSDSPDFGSGNFLDAIMTEAAQKSKVVLKSGKSSSKDYINVSDAAKIIVNLSSLKGSGIYNVASGINTMNEKIEKFLNMQGINVEYGSDVGDNIFPQITIEKILKLGLQPKKRLEEDFPNIFAHYKEKFKTCSVV